MEVMKPHINKITICTQTDTEGNNRNGVIKDKRLISESIQTAYDEDRKKVYRKNKSLYGIMNYKEYDKIINIKPIHFQCKRNYIQFTKTRNINNPVIIKDKSKLQDYIQKNTVANFNNKYNCLISYDKKKKTKHKESNYEQYYRSIFSLKKKTRNHCLTDNGFHTQCNSMNHHSTEENLFPKIHSLSNINMNSYEKLSPLKNSIIVKSSLKKMTFNSFATRAKYSRKISNPMFK